MYTPVDRRAVRRRIHLRIRKKVTGTAERPRLVVFRSNKHIYAQAVDDAHGRTVAAASTLESETRGRLTSGGKSIEAAKIVGSSLGARLKEKGIESIVFDRGGYRYHGRVRALADALREAGVKF